MTSWKRTGGAWRPAAALAACLAFAEPAAAQEAAPWLYRAAFEIQSLGTACLSDGRPGSLHVLGVTEGADLSEIERGTIAADLTDMLAGHLGVRVTKADSLGEIAGAYGGSAEDAAELAALIDATSRADVTLLVAPLARRGTALDAEIRIWTRDATGIACAPSFRVAIPLQAADPVCEQAFGTARAAQDAGRLEAFAEFLPHCPEAVTARALARDMREATDQEARAETCRVEFQEALAMGTVAALDLFVERSADCPEYQTALTVRETVRAREICEAAYSEATLTDTEDGYADYARRHAACPQASAARSRLDALRAGRQAAAAPTPQAPMQAPAPVAPQTHASAPSCDELWYQRNAIYDAAGYCFNSARARSVFDNAGCTGGTPTGGAAREVDRIVALERRLGCR